MNQNNYNHGNNYSNNYNDGRYSDYDRYGNGGNGGYSGYGNDDGNADGNDDGDSLPVEINNELRGGLSKINQISDLIKETNKLIGPLRERLKQLRGEKKILELNLYPTLAKYQVTDGSVQLDNKMVEFVCKTTKSKETITQKNIKEKMISFFSEGPGKERDFATFTPTVKGELMHDYIYGIYNRKIIDKPKIIIK